MPHTQCWTSTVPALLAESGPCAGPMWESPHYYPATGKSLYRCEHHAKRAMRINPFGPSYRPVGKPRTPKGA